MLVCVCDSFRLDGVKLTSRPGVLVDRATDPLALMVLGELALTPPYWGIVGFSKFDCKITS